MRFPNDVLAFVLVFSTGVFAGCHKSQSHPDAEESVANAAFARLQRLVGQWKCTSGAGRTVELTYRLVASDSVLVETFLTTTGKETLTLFHLDGSRLLATHYCGQGNQPRLRLTRASERSFDFRFQDATNLVDPASAHLTKLELELPDADTYRKTETYVAASDQETTRFDCARLH